MKNIVIWNLQKAAKSSKGQRLDNVAGHMARMAGERAVDVFLLNEVSTTRADDDAITRFLRVLPDWRGALSDVSVAERYAVLWRNCSFTDGDDATHVRRLPHVPPLREHGQATRAGGARILSGRQLGYIKLTRRESDDDLEMEFDFYVIHTSPLVKRRQVSGGVVFKVDARAMKRQYREIRAWARAQEVPPIVVVGGDFNYAPGDDPWFPEQDTHQTALGGIDGFVTNLRTGAEDDDEDDDEEMDEGEEAIVQAIGRRTRSTTSRSDHLPVMLTI